MPIVNSDPLIVRIVSSFTTASIIKWLAPTSSLIVLLFNWVTTVPTPCGPTKTKLDPFQAYN